MGKLIGIGLIVLGIWVGLEVYTEGTDRAFGGILARFGASSQEQAVERPLDNVRGIARGARDEQMDRIERQLGREIDPEEN